MRQRGESNDEFGEKVRRLVTQAYPGTDLEMEDQLAAEAFLRGYRNSRIAFDVLNKRWLAAKNIITGPLWVGIMIS